MKTYKISGLLATIFFLLSLHSCGEDKFYELDGYVYGQVAFTAVNLNASVDLKHHIVNTAESTANDYGYNNLPDKYQSFIIPVITGVTFDGVYQVPEPLEIKIEKESTIWSGGYNEIEVTFFPKDPEEKEATFTMPDGTVFTATSQNPTFIWVPDSTFRNVGYLNYEESFIKAESSYKKGKTQYKNTGYIYVNMDYSTRFNSANQKWYYSNWINNSHLSYESYMQFSVENLTVGRGDKCISYNPYFDETLVYKRQTLSIPYIVSNNQEETYETVLTGNDIFICGNNDIRITFIPIGDEKEMLLNLPNGIDVKLTVENPSYIWHVSQEDARNYQWYNKISGRITYEKDNVTFNCEGQVDMYIASVLWYDAESGVFYNSNWPAN